jgi:hypothetical protein
MSASKMAAISENSEKIGKKAASEKQAKYEESGGNNVK